MSNRRPALPSSRPPGGMDPNAPQAGRWLVKTGPGRPPMPASISKSYHEPGSDPPNWLDTGPVWVANIGWKEADPLEVWAKVRKIRQLPRHEYDYHMTRVLDVKEHHPDEPEAQPHKPVDLAAIPPIEPP